MKHTTQMQKQITALAALHNFDLTAPYGHLSLEPVYNQPLVIEKHGKDTVAVAHITSDGLALDPMIRFHISKTGVWYPIAEHFAMFGFTRVLASPEGKPGSWRVNPRGQRDAATFANQWAGNIKSQKWAGQTAARSFTAQANTAWLIAPDDTVTEQTPESMDEGFGLKQLYAMLDCQMVEVIHLDDPDWIMIGDEEGKYGEYEVNGIATRLARLDERRDEFAGRALLCPTTWFK